MARQPANWLMSEYGRAPKTTNRVPNQAAWVVRDHISRRGNKRSSTVQGWLANDGALRPMLQAMLWSAWALLALSTMLVKQHYMFDAVTTFIIGAVLWRMWCKPVINQTAH